MHYLEKTALIDAITSHAVRAVEYQIHDPDTFLVVQAGSTQQPGKLSAALRLRMRHTSERADIHTVTVGVLRAGDQDRFYYGCGEGYLANPPGFLAERDRRVRTAVHEFDEAKRPELLRILGEHTQRHWKTAPQPDAKCQASSDPCGHCRHAFHFLLDEERSNPGALENRLTELTECLHRALGIEAPVEEPRDSSGAGRGREIEKKRLISLLERIAGPSVRVKVPVLIQGEHGASKTHTAREFGRTAGFDEWIEAQGHAGMEALDFIGGQIPEEGGRLTWMDGPIAQAFRAAAEGRNVFLLVDEIYRVRRRERSIFLSALSPHRGVYRLRTGRPIGKKNGVAKMELLEAPVERLAIVATTNVGAGYDVEKDDDAMRERWFIFHMSSDSELVRSILTESARSRGWEDARADELASFFEALTFLKREGGVAQRATVRTLDRAIHLAASEAALPSAVMDCALSWVDLDQYGQPDAEQLAAVERAVRRVWPKAKW